MQRTLHRDSVLWPSIFRSERVLSVGRVVFLSFITHLLLLSPSNQGRDWFLLFLCFYVAVGVEVVVLARCQWYQYLAKSHYGSVICHWLPTPTIHRWGQETPNHKYERTVGCIVPKTEERKTYIPLWAVLYVSLCRTLSCLPFYYSPSLYLCIRYCPSLYLCIRY